VSAQEQNWQDDQERDDEQDEQRDPTQQSPTHREGEREVGDEGQEQGSEKPRGAKGSEEDESDAERALQNERESIEHGHETPA
jgi:hypothetical protein